MWRDLKFYVFGFTELRVVRRAAEVVPWVRLAHLLLGLFSYL